MELGVTVPAFSGSAKAVKETFPLATWFQTTEKSPSPVKPSESLILDVKIVNV